MSSTVPSSRSMAECGDGFTASDIKNYRPISLLPIIYKVFSHILLQWIPWTLDFHQPQEQAGFRSGFSMTDQLHVVNQLQERAHEYSIPLCFALMDSEKAFDNIEVKPIFHALENHGVDKAYLDIIKHMYCKATSVIFLHTDSEKFRLQRGVRQGDNISTRLFTSCPQDIIIGKINWKDKSFRINGKYLPHLIFTDDIVLITKSTSELQKMLPDFHETRKPVGLNMHLGKTEVKCNYVVWQAGPIMQNKSIPPQLKTTVHNEFILPVITYRSETWSLSKIQL